ncbi:MAG: hypothetical protein E7Z63_01150 [Thermoplasmata archaeon]|nr:hypothetical protein [Thermoplasmata archaeon]
MNGYRTNKAVALSLVAILMVSSLGCLMVTEGSDESDAGLNIKATQEKLSEPSVAFTLLTMGPLVGAAVLWWSDTLTGSGDVDTDAYLRVGEANNVRNMVKTATVFTSNAHQNYAQLWGLTKEHWVRQAELEAFSLWDGTKTYDSIDVLTGSLVFDNNTVMTANAVAQIDLFFDEMTKHFKLYEDYDAYDGMIHETVSLGGTGRFSATNDLEMRLMSVADASKGEVRVYIGTIDAEKDFIKSDEIEDHGVTYAPGWIQNLGQSTITIGGVTIPSGERAYISDENFTAGVYTIPAGAVIGGDTLSQVIGGVSLTAGLYVRSGDNFGYIHTVGDKFAYGTEATSFETLEMEIGADDIPSDDDVKNPGPFDISNVLTSYQKLLDKLSDVTKSANTAASTVWGIYDDAHAKNHYVTTTLESVNYDGMVLSKEMNRIMEIFAMKQLVDYWAENKDNLENLQISLLGTDEDMYAPFVRGTIYDRLGLPIYTDVIFTPLFQNKDVTLDVGTVYDVDQTVIVAIWADGSDQTLRQWAMSGMETGDYAAQFLEDGCSIEVKDLGLCYKGEGDSAPTMHTETSVQFKINRVNYIEPEEVKPTPPTPPPKDGGDANILKLICIVLGAVLIVWGVLRRNILNIIIGIAFILFAVMLADQVYEWVQNLV